MASFFMTRYKMIYPDIEIIRERRREEMERQRFKDYEKIKLVDEEIKRDIAYVNELKKNLLTKKQIQEINENIQSLEKQREETNDHHDKAYIHNDILKEERKLLNDKLNKMYISEIEGSIEKNSKFIKKSLNKRILSGSKLRSKKHTRKSNKVIKKTKSKKFKKKKSKKSKKFKKKKPKKL